MKCQILFSRKSKKNITNLSSAKSAPSMVSANSFIAQTLDTISAPVAFISREVCCLLFVSFSFKGEPVLALLLLIALCRPILLLCVDQFHCSVHTNFIALCRPISLLCVD